MSQARDIIADEFASPASLANAAADDILAALRAAANASPTDTITVAADGTVGRLAETKKTWCSYHGGDRIFCHNPLDCDVSPLYRIVTP